jgi:hypothetical protein
LAFLASGPPTTGRLGELRDKFLEQYDTVFRIAVCGIFGLSSSRILSTLSSPTACASCHLSVQAMRRAFESAGSDMSDDAWATTFADTHLDFACGFWQVRVRDEDIQKTAFKTPDSFMEWVAMPFGLCNAPTKFLRVMNDILRDFLHKFVTVYIDDVCIYCRTLQEHMAHLRLVHQRFKEEGLKLRLKKCFFGLQEMEYLGYTMSTGRISVSTNKVEAVAD